MGCKINCKFKDQGAWCTNSEIKKSLFGLGARVCVEYPPMYGITCMKKEEYPKPPAPPPARLITEGK